MKKRLVALISGGMDSVAAFYAASLEHEVVAGLSFDYGSKHNHREIPFAKFHCEKFKVPHTLIPLDFVGVTFKSILLKSGGEVPEGHYEEATMKQTVVPFRNGIMLSVAAGFAESAGAHGVVIAAHAGDHAIYPDCREEFMRAMGDAIRLGTYAAVEIFRPFIHLTKAQIVAEGNRLGVDFAKTWSCYKGLDLHCGACGTCIERREAFMLSGIPDPTKYASTPAIPGKPV